MHEEDHQKVWIKKRFSSPPALTDVVLNPSRLRDVIELQVIIHSHYIYITVFIKKTYI